jgi:hypothetical protein
MTFKNAIKGGYEKKIYELQGGLTSAEVYMYGMAFLTGMVLLVVGGIFLTSSTCLNNETASKKCTAGKWLFWGGTILAFYPVVVKITPVFAYVFLNMLM